MTETADKELKQARIVSTRPRQIEVDLDWPVEFDGKVWDKITVRRVTGREVEQFLADIGVPDKPRGAPPMLDCPLEVYDALDDDDRLRLEGAMLPFLPQRLRMAADFESAASANSETSSEQ